MSQPVSSLEKSAPIATPPDLIEADVLERISDGFFALDRDWRFTYLNREAERLLRRSREEVIGTSALEMFEGAMGSPFHRAMSQAMEAGVTVELEQHYPALATWFEVRVYPSAHGISVYFRDVTERKLAAARARVEAVQGPEQRLRLVAQVTSDVLWDYDFPRNELWTSDTFHSVFGHPPGAIGDRLDDWAALVHSEDRAELLERIRRAAAARHPAWSAEYRVRRADGSHAHVLHRSRLLYDDDGSPLRSVGSIIDITERREAEDRQRFLAEAMALLSSSMDYGSRLATLARLSVPTLADLCVVDLLWEDGSIRRVEVAHADPARQELAEKLLRFPPRGDDVWISRVLRAGKPFLIRHVDDAALQRVAISPEHLEVLRGLGIESAIVVPLGARDRKLGTITFLRSEGPRHGRADLDLAVDLGARAGFAVENARLLRDAQQASRAKSDFLSVMSHELRTPLSAILGYAELVLGEVPGDLTPAQRRYMERLRTSGVQLLRLVEEILGFSRIEGGAREICVGACDATDIAREAAAAVEPLALEKGLALRLEGVEAPLPMRTDPDRLRQILVNLLANGVKYTEEGEVRLEAVQENGTVSLRVVDTGIGIPAEHRERIFEPFWQADQTTTRRVGGIGLGLTVVRRLVTLLGGEVSVDATPEGGSVFEVRLPKEPPFP